MSAFAVVSCKDDDDAVAASISAEKTSVNYEFTRSEQRLNVRATVAWTAATDASWIHLTKTSYDANEDRVIFIVDENLTKDARQGTITVSCSAGSVTFTITQEGAHAVDVPTKHYDITSEGGKLKITMAANTDIDVEVIEGDEWLTFEEVGGMGTQFPYMIFNAEANDNEDERYATVKVKEKGTPDDQAITLTMTQKEKDIFTPQGETEYQVSGSEKTELTLGFATNISYLENISDPSWIIPVKEEPQETKTNSVKDGQLKYNILQSNNYYDRVGTITIVKYGTETEMVKYTIKQFGNPILSLNINKKDYKSQETINIDPESIELNVKITHNLPQYPQATSSDESWARFTPSVDGYTLEVDENDSGEDREATLTFSDLDGKASPVELTLKQKKRAQE